MLKSIKLKGAAITMVAAIVAAVPRLANACATCGLADGGVAPACALARVFTSATAQIKNGMANRSMQPKRLSRRHSIKVGGAARKCAGHLLRMTNRY